MENNDRNPAGSTTYSERVASIPVIKETIRLDSEMVDTGTVRIIKKVDEETVRVPLLTREDEYHIERVPVNQYVDEAPPAVRYEGDTMIVSVIVEEAVIQTRLKVIEEVRITATKKETAWEEDITIKKETVTVERQSTKSENQS